jgi:uncharacterized membrane protein YedE/YeeE
MKPLVAFICGLVFAIGLAVAGMTQPSKIIGFLDVAGGAWDPSLAFVMLGGIPLVALARRLRPARPLLAAAYPTLRHHGIDRKLVIGSVLFGIGWALAGFCPGPAIVALGAGVPGAITFCGAMLAGMTLFHVSDL